jgi:hypothetical protein
MPEGRRATIDLVVRPPRSFNYKTATWPTHLGLAIPRKPTATRTKPQATNNGLNSLDQPQRASIFFLNIHG